MHALHTHTRVNARAYKRARTNNGTGGAMSTAESFVPKLTDDEQTRLTRVFKKIDSDSNGSQTNN